MLSDHEWKALREVERGFLTEDPRFAQAFDARAEGLRRAQDGWGMRILVVAGLLLSLLMLVVGSLGGALAVAAATWLTWQVARVATDPDKYLW